MSKKIILVGGGGHCKSVLDSLFELNEYEEIGIIDKSDSIGDMIMGVRVVGCDGNLLALFRDGYQYAFITIGSVGDVSLRRRLFNTIKEIGYEIPSIIDTSAKISSHVEIGRGVFIGKRCILNIGTVIKEGAIINTGTIIEHDCQVGEFSHIAPGVVLGGEVVIGNNSHIGANSTVKQQVKVGSNSIIGMGSIVLKNVSSNTLAYGTPCREIKSL